MAEADAQSNNGYFSTLYFGYASNLSPVTLKQRCPGALYAGMAILKDYKFTINATRFGNLVPSPGDVAYGALAFLSSRDEAALDESEGVPWMYQKQTISVTRVGADGKEGDNPQVVEAMSYIDTERKDEGIIEPDYVVWIHKAIEDSLKCGVPQSYVDKYLRPWAPISEEDPQEIIMVRTLQSQVFNAKYATMLNPDLYDKTRGKSAGVAQAYEGSQK